SPRHPDRRGRTPHARHRARALASVPAVVVGPRVGASPAGGVPELWAWASRSCSPPRTDASAREAALRLRTRAALLLDELRDEGGVARGGRARGRRPFLAPLSSRPPLAGGGAR